jgi:hypothetical protein
MGRGACYAAPMTDQPEEEFVVYEVLLEPAVADLLERIAESKGTTAQALAIEAVTNFALMIATEGDDDVAAEMRQEGQLESQFSYIRDTIEDFDIG